MPQGLTKNLILLISGCFLLSQFQTNLQFEFALYPAAIDQGQWYRLITVALVHGINYSGLSAWRLAAFNL